MSYCCSWGEDWSYLQRQSYFLWINVFLIVNNFIKLLDLFNYLNHMNSALTKASNIKLSRFSKIGLTLTS